MKKCIRRRYLAIIAPTPALKTEGMKLERGLMFQSEFTLPNNQKGQVLCSVVDIRGDNVILYLGNPLAGQTVRFYINIIEVREATEEDIRLLAQQYQMQQ